MDPSLGRDAAVLETVRLVARLYDMAVVRRQSSKAVVILALPNTFDHSAKLRLVVVTTLMCLFSFDRR
jgi:hypothetical protein